MLEVAINILHRPTTQKLAAAEKGTSLIKIAVFSNFAISSLLIRVHSSAGSPSCYDPSTPPPSYFLSTPSLPVSEEYFTGPNVTFFSFLFDANSIRTREEADIRYFCF